jgi:apolipoprotein N-acyltransferase
VCSGRRRNRGEAPGRRQAIETQRYLIRAANTGISAIVAPGGEIIWVTALFTPAVLVGGVSAIAGHTPYVQYGDVFAWSTVLVSAVAAVVCIATRRSKTVGTTPAVERGDTSEPRTAPFETGGHN